MNEFDAFVSGIGALSETLGLFRSELKKNGFEEPSITILCGELLRILVKRSDD